MSCNPRLTNQDHVTIRHFVIQSHLRVQFRQQHMHLLLLNAVLFANVHDEVFRKVVFLLKVHKVWNVLGDRIVDDWRFVVQLFLSLCWFEDWGFRLRWDQWFQFAEKTFWAIIWTVITNTERNSPLSFFRLRFLSLFQIWLLFDLWLNWMVATLVPNLFLTPYFMW